MAGVRAGFPGGKKTDVRKPGTALAIPKPINLPSRRKENNGFDPSMPLVPAGAAGSWIGGARPGAAGAMGAAGVYPGHQLSGVAQRPSGTPTGWGSNPTAANAATSGGSSGGDFPELGGPARPANPWNAPTAAPLDTRGRYIASNGVPRRPLMGEGRGDGGRDGRGGDWAEENEEEPMDFKRPVVIDRQSAAAASMRSKSDDVAIGGGSSTTLPSSAPCTSAQPDSVSVVKPLNDPREEARMLALKKKVKYMCALLGEWRGRHVLSVPLFPPRFNPPCSQSHLLLFPHFGTRLRFGECACLFACVCS